MTHFAVSIALNGIIVNCSVRKVGIQKAARTAKKVLVSYELDSDKKQTLHVSLLWKSKVTADWLLVK